MKLFVSIPQGSAPMKRFLTEDVKKYLDERFEVTYSPFDRQLTREELMQFIQDKDAVMTGWGSITMDEEMLEDTTVKLIVHTGGSVGSLVTPEVYEMGVRVLSGNELYADSVADELYAPKAGAYQLSMVSGLLNWKGEYYKGNRLMITVNGWEYAFVLEEDSLLDSYLRAYYVGFGSELGQIELQEGRNVLTLKVAEFAPGNQVGMPLMNLIIEKWR